MVTTPLSDVHYLGRPTCTPHVHGCRLYPNNRRRYAEYMRVISTNKSHRCVKRSPRGYRIVFGQAHRLSVPQKVPSLIPPIGCQFGSARAHPLRSHYSSGLSCTPGIRQRLDGLRKMFGPHRASRRQATDVRMRVVSAESLMGLGVKAMKPLRSISMPRPDRWLDYRQKSSVKIIFTSLLAGILCALCNLYLVLEVIEPPYTPFIYIALRKHPNPAHLKKRHIPTKGT